MEICGDCGAFGKHAGFIRHSLKPQRLDNPAVHVIRHENQQGDAKATLIRHSRLVHVLVHARARVCVCTCACALSHARPHARPPTRQNIKVFDQGQSQNSKACDDSRCMLNRPISDLEHGKMLRLHLLHGRGSPAAAATVFMLAGKLGAPVVIQPWHQQHSLALPWLVGVPHPGSVAASLKDYQIFALSKECPNPRRAWLGLA